MKFDERATRVGIFFVYDGDGIIDNYIVYLLNSLKGFMDRLIVVSNGLLTAESKNKLKKITDEILIRDNTGFDGWAYKYGIDYIGWDRMRKYDELIMFNHTIMGPVNSFEEMFQDMDGRDLDFWGITKHHKVDFDPFGGCEYGYIPEHIQSHFIAVRKTLLISKEFRDYWDNFPEITSYKEAISKHEAIFTKKFSDMEYKWDTYVQTDDIEFMNRYPLMYMPVELVKNRKCPIFKRRMFFTDQADILANSVGNTASDFLKYLKEFGKYDVNMIWDNILRTCNQADIVRCLNLRYVLSGKDYDLRKAMEILKTRKVALVMHIYFEDLIEDMCRYASYMPKEADIYVTTDTPKKKERIEALFREKLVDSHIDVRLIANRGRDVSSLLVGVKDCILDYDFVCFVHDKKTAQVKPGTVGVGFANKCFENTMFNPAFILNMIELFEENPRLGIASPPGPNHADFFGAIGNEWGPNYKITVELAEQIGIKVPISEKKMAVAPYGTMFWFRPLAFKKLYDFDWEYEDFLIEPNKNDGTLLHAIERVYPYVAQAEGYYPAIVMSDYYAGIELTNLDYYVRSFNNAVADLVGYSYHYILLEKLKKLKISSADTIKLLDKCNDLSGEKYELELKALETMKYVDGLHQELAEVKGKKYELELKALETMQYIEQLQRKATLKYQLTKFIRKGK